MPHKPIPPRIVLLLVATIVILPMTITIVLAVGGVLSGMGDLAGGYVLGRIALALGILWAVTLVALVLLQSINALSETDEPPDA